MKRWYAVWYNPLAQQEQVEFIIAGTEEEAEELMVMIMKSFAGNSFTKGDIEYIAEFDESFFQNREAITNRYNICCGNK